MISGFFPFLLFLKFLVNFSRFSRFWLDWCEWFTYCHRLTHRKSNKSNNKKVKSPFMLLYFWPPCATLGLEQLYTILFGVKYRFPHKQQQKSIKEYVFNRNTFNKNRQTIQRNEFGMVYMNRMMERRRHIHVN